MSSKVDSGGKIKTSWTASIDRAFKNCNMRRKAQKYALDHYPNADKRTQQLAFNCYIAGWLEAKRIKNSALRIVIP